MNSKSACRFARRKLSGYENAWDPVAVTPSVPAPSLRLSLDIAPKTSIMRLEGRRMERREFLSCGVLLPVATLLADKAVKEEAGNETQRVCPGVVVRRGAVRGFLDGFRVGPAGPA